MKINSIAILTSGGDCPGMNPAVRAVAKKARQLGITPYLILDGYRGLVGNKIEKCSYPALDQHLTQGGTLIYSARFPEFADQKYQKIAVENLKAKNIDALVVIGGDGSYRGAQALSRLGVRTIGLPGTIDNNIASSDYTIGFFTALETITQAVEQIADTARSHHRVIIVEVMGNGVGDLAAYAGIATSPIVISTNENKKSHAEIIAAIKRETHNPSVAPVVLVSEMLHDLNKMSDDIRRECKVDTRIAVLGHTQRGGRPSAIERVLATLMGIKAVDLLLAGQTAKCVGYANGKMESFDIEEALKFPRKSIKDLVDEINELNAYMSDEPS